jgi:alkaline phosphatase D
VEYATPSISSPNLDEQMGTFLAAGMEAVINQPSILTGNVNYNPHLRYVDLDRHGYFILDIKPDSIHADFYYVIRLDTADNRLSDSVALKTVWNSNKVSAAVRPAPTKAVQDVPTPVAPPTHNNAVASVKTLALFGTYPNPAARDLFVHMGLAREQVLQITARSINGSKAAVLLRPQQFSPGVYNLRLSLDGLPAAGTYLVTVSGPDFSESFKVQVIR